MDGGPTSHALFPPSPFFTYPTVEKHVTLSNHHSISRRDFSSPTPAHTGAFTAWGIHAPRATAPMAYNTCIPSHTQYTSVFSLGSQPTHSHGVASENTQLGWSRIPHARASERAQRRYRMYGRGVDVIFWLVCVPEWVGLVGCGCVLLCYG